MLDQLSDFFCCCNTRGKPVEAPTTTAPPHPQTTTANPDLPTRGKSTSITDAPTWTEFTCVNVMGAHVEVQYHNLGNNGGPAYPCGVEASFSIVSYDSTGLKEEGGGQHFDVVVQPVAVQQPDAPPIQATVTDNNNGTYTVVFVVPPTAPGEYLVTVRQAGVPVQGTPFRTAFADRRCIDDTTVGKTLPAGHTIDISRGDSVAVRVPGVPSVQKGTPLEQQAIYLSALTAYTGFTSPAGHGELGGHLCLAQLSYLHSSRVANTPSTAPYGESPVQDPMLYSPAVLNLILDTNPSSLYNLVVAKKLEVVSCVASGFMTGEELRLRLRNLTTAPLSVSLPLGGVFEPATSAFTANYCMVNPVDAGSLLLGAGEEEEIAVGMRCLSMTGIVPANQRMALTPFLFRNDAACLRSQSSLWEYADTLRPARLAIGWGDGPRTGPAEAGPDVGLDFMYPHLTSTSNTPLPNAPKFEAAELDVLIPVMRVYNKDPNVQKKGAELVSRFFSAAVSIHAVCAIVQQYQDQECVVKNGSHKAWVLLKASRDVHLAAAVAQRYTNVRSLKEKAAHAIFAILTDLMDVDEAAAVVNRYADVVAVREQAALAVYTILKELKDVYLAAMAVQRYAQTDGVQEKAASAVNAILKDLKDVELAATVVSKYAHVPAIRDKAASAVCSILTAIKDVDLAVSVLQKYGEVESVARQAGLAIGAILRERRDPHLAESVIHRYSHIKRVKVEAGFALKMIRK